MVTGCAGCRCQRHDGAQRPLRSIVVTNRLIVRWLSMPSAQRKQLGGDTE